MILLRSLPPADFACGMHVLKNKKSAGFILRAFSAIGLFSKNGRSFKKIYDKLEKTILKTAFTSENKRFFSEFFEISVDNTTIW